MRRNIVIRLIDEMKQRGHAAYVNLDMDRVRAKASILPEDGVPPEIVRLLPLDKAHDKLQPNKNATPVQGAVLSSEVSKEMACTRMNAVVSEVSSLNQGDDAAKLTACLTAITRNLKKGVLPPGNDRGDGSDDDVSQDAADQIVERIGVKAGNDLIDQYEPIYWGTAFAFTFSYYGGFPDMPAFTHKPRHRRSGPRIETAEWVRTMSRRIEASLSQDYTFGYVSWNYHFRSELNLSRSMLGYDKRNGEKTGAVFTPEALEAGAVEITEHLWGKYRDCNGKLKNVNGDIAKVEYVPQLSDAARML